MNKNQIYFSTSVYQINVIKHFVDTYKLFKFCFEFEQKQKIKGKTTKTSKYQKFEDI